MYTKKIIKNVSMALVFSLISVILAYFFRILLAKKLSIVTYGQFYALFSLFSMLIILTDLGLGMIVIRKIIGLRSKKNYQSIKYLLIVTTKIQLGMSIIIGLLVYLLADSISINILKSSKTLYIFLMMIWFITLPIYHFYDRLFQGFEKTVLALSLDFTKQLTIILLLYVCMFFGLKEQSPFIAFALVNIIVFCIYYITIKKIFPNIANIKSKKDSKLLKDVIKSGAYIMISSMILSIMIQTDSLLLSYFKGPVAVALYQSAQPVGNVLMILSSVYIFTIFPIISGFHERGKFKEICKGINQAYKFILIVSLPVAIIIFVFSRKILTLMYTSEYTGAESALKIFAFIGVISLMNAINNNNLIALGANKDIAMNMLQAAIVNLVLNIILIPKYGVAGACTASLISISLAFVASTYRLKKYLDWKIPYKNWLLILISGTITLVFAHLLALVISPVGLWNILIMLILCGMTYIGIIFAIKIISIGEIKEYYYQITKKN